MNSAAKMAFFRTIGYVPQPKQILFHNSQARFRIPCCGRRFGKSKMASADLEAQLFEQRKRFWIIGPTYDLGEKEFRYIWFDLIVDKKLGQDKRVKKAFNKKQGEMYIEFPWGTRVEVRSAQHPEDLVGEALDGAIMSEAAKHKRETWERFIRPSLADNRGWATFPSTPEGFNFFHEMWQNGQNPDLADYESWRFPSWMNHAVYPLGADDPEIELLRKTMPEEWFDQEIAANFGAFVGKIFGEWDETIHVTDVKYDPMLPTYGTFDWGFTNPLAFIEFQVTPMDEIRVFREHYLAFHPLERHVEILKSRENPEGYHLDLTFGDAADPDAALYVSTHFAPCIADPRAKQNWRVGVDLIKRHLRLYEVGKSDEYGTPLEAPKMVVDRSCKNTIREFNNYRISPVAGRDDRNPREAAQKYDDHAIDGLRYGLVSIYELGATSHLSDVYVPSRTTDSGLYVASDGDLSGIFTYANMREF